MVKPPATGTPTESLTETPEGRRHWAGMAERPIADLRAIAAALAPGVYSGLLCGAVIGGGGGRLAMLLLRLTSDASLHGRRTDDDFTIGVFTAATIFLIAATAAVGTVGGVCYALTRPWLPVRQRSALTGAFLAITGGALIIHPGGVDFTLLAPLWLAVGLFVLLPGVYGVALSLLAEWIDRRRWVVGWLAWPALLIPGVLGIGIGPAGVAILGGCALIVIFGQGQRLAVGWRSGLVTWLGRAGLTALLVGGAINLARDMSAIF